MPSQTNFAQLALYNNSTDATTKYGEFRAAIAGIDSDSNMNKIDRILQQNDTDINSINSSISSINSSIESLEAKDDSLDSDISSLRTRVTTNENNISDLESSVDGMNSTISGLSSRLSTAESDISQVESDVGGLETSVSNISSRLGTAESDINQLESDMGQAKSDISSLQSSKAITTTYNATIGTNWSNNGSFVQTVSVPGILSTDNPIVDIVLNSNMETARTELENYAKISEITTTDEAIYIRCFDERPEVAMNIQLKVIR